MSYYPYVPYHNIAYFKCEEVNYRESGGTADATNGANDYFFLPGVRKTRLAPIFPPRKYEFYNAGTSIEYDAHHEKGHPQIEGSFLGPMVNCNLLFLMGHSLLSNNDLGGGVYTHIWNSGTSTYAKPVSFQVFIDQNNDTSAQDITQLITGCIIDRWTLKWYANPSKGAQELQGDFQWKGSRIVEGTTLGVLAPQVAARAKPNGQTFSIIHLISTAGYNDLLLDSVAYQSKCTGFEIECEHTLDGGYISGGPYFAVPAIVRRMTKIRLEFMLHDKAMFDAITGLDPYATNVLSWKMRFQRTADDYLEIAATGLMIDPGESKINKEKDGILYATITCILSPYEASSIIITEKNSIGITTDQSPYVVHGA